MVGERQAICRNGDFKTRAADGNLYIEGYFATFTGEYRMLDKAVERIDREAFDGTLGDDIRALVNHDTTIVLGRTTSGTLTLRVDDIGLWGSILVNQADQDAMNAYERVKRGDVSQCSFGFDTLSEETEIRPDGTTVWTLKKVKLYEVSVVTFPAYEDTMVEARRKDLEKINERKLEQWRADALKKVKGKGC
mgnify:FL=1